MEPQMSKPCRKHHLLSFFFLFFISLCNIHLAKAQDTPLPFFATYPNIDLSTWYISNGWSNGEHQACEWRAGAVDAYFRNLRITVSNQGGAIRPYGCGEIQSRQRFGYGRFEARLRAAAGSGLNTAFFTYIGPPMGVAEHDEIDFEFLGKDPTVVELNYWVNGKQQPSYKHNLGFDATRDFHIYAFEWRPTSIKWFVDGILVHETPPNAPIPKQPGKLFFSLWSGTQIEDDWMGKFVYTSPVSAMFSWARYRYYNLQ